MADLATTTWGYFGTDMVTGYEGTVVMGDVLWMLVSGFIMSFILACGLGANDVANSFATSVGAKVLTLPKACILASIFETAGAVLLGAKVSDTIRKGIFDVTLYEGQEEVLMLGQVCALGGACIWMLLATYMKMPVSGTHSIVGAMLGFHLVVFQLEGINWQQFGFIVGSWFLSPIMSGLVSSIIFVIYRKLVLSKDEPLEPGLKIMPIFYGLVIIINCVSIFIDGPKLFHLDRIPVWGVMLLSFGVGISVGLVIFFFFVPRWRKQLQKDLEKSSDQKPGCEMNDVLEDNEVKVPLQDTDIEIGYANGNGACANGNANCSNGNGAFAIGNANINMNHMHEEEENPMVNSVSLNSTPETVKEPSRFSKFKGAGGRTWNRLLSNSDAEKSSKRKPTKLQESEAWKSVQDHPVVARLCTPLQIMSAVFASFAHGGNDVSNAIGPLIALWAIYTTEGVAQKQATPIWILVYGGVGITFGLWLLGRRVIETVGSNLTPMTPSSGFTIELGAAFTVLLASNIGIPISTTHCKVGSVVAIGKVRSSATVEWRLFCNIIVAWIITVPITAGLSGALMAGLRLVL